jgi:hypothetical protein
MKTKKDIRHKSIITQAKSLGTNGKHAGSKPIKRLLSNINRAKDAMTDNNKLEQMFKMYETKL